MRDNNGRFVKGVRPSPETEIKNGEHKSRATEFKKGMKPHNYKGGSLHKSGYIYIYEGGVQRKRSRVIAEKDLGRKLLKSEYIHHIDGDKTNDSLNNLCLCQNQAEHLGLHKLMGGGN